MKKLIALLLCVSLLLIMILVNVFNSIKELIRNKRIAAEKNAAETSEDAPVAK